MFKNAKDAPITFHSGAAAGHVRFLRQHLARILADMGISDARWHIRIVRDAEMKCLHAQTLGLDTTTDVLTFDLREYSVTKDREGVAVELDSAICIDEARRRGVELHHPLRNELLLYCVHSLLHVQGYNDLTPSQSQRMHAREDAILTAIGVGPVYAVEKPGLTSRPSTLRNRKSRGGTA